RQHDDATTAPHVTARMEDVGGIALVIADPEGQPRAGAIAQLNWQGSTRCVAREVFGRIPHRDQGLLENAPERRFYLETAGVETLAQVRAYLGLADQFLQQRSIGTNEA